MPDLQGQKQPHPSTESAASSASSQPTEHSSYKPLITLDQLITLAIEQEASDIHFSAGSRIALRIGGQFMFIQNIDQLPEKDAEMMVRSMLKSEEELKRLERVRELDFSYIHSSGVSFRVNVFYSRGKLSAVLRMISKHLPSMEELGIPEVMKSFLGLREGLILVTGTAGSGKSTSVQAMLEHVNQNYIYHIITIENPIEHVFKDNKSIFSQRELGKDTLTFSNALHSASREDPNIVMVSEINDRETMDAVLSLVEMGYLVIASTATRNVKQTIEHLISYYPNAEQEAFRDRLSATLAVILSQDLLDRIDQKGRIAVYELLVANNAVKHIIKHDSLSQLRTAMENGAQEGMVTMDNYAYNLAERNIISREDAERYSATEQ
jgi:twitching motility protein PilT